MRDAMLLSVALGGLPAVLLVVAFGPRPPDGPGFLVWLVAPWGVGWASAALFYRLVQAFRSRR
jgi:hypothetical protein